MSVQSVQTVPAHVLRYLAIERCLPEWAVRHLGLSWDAEKRAIVIPIDGATKYRSLLAYDPISGVTQQSDPKMWWAARPPNDPLPPYPTWNDWRDEHCEVIVEGEFDAMCAIANGVLAVSGTAGASTMKDEWAAALTGQTRTIIYDNDQAGREGAVKAAEKLTGAGCRVRIASWPVDAPDGYDVTDFFRAGHGAEELRAILAAATEYRRQPDPAKYARRRVVAA